MGGEDGYNEDSAEHVRKAKSHEVEAEHYIGLSMAHANTHHGSNVINVGGVYAQIAQVHATLALAHYTATR